MKPRHAVEVQRLVHAFYEKVRRDPVLGPVFHARLEGRWEAHLEKMCRFWGSVLHATGGYVGDPIGSHARLPGVASEHFDRWMELFEQTAKETLPPYRALDVTARAARMRVVLERHAEKDAVKHPPATPSEAAD